MFHKENNGALQVVERAAAQEGKRDSARILIVDDEREIRLMLSDYLEAQGFSCSDVTDGAHALERLASEQVEVVVSDVKMPGMSGLELVAALSQRHPTVGVILISAYADMPMAIEGMKAGAYDFLSKPVDLRKLPLIIERALERQRLKAQNQNYLARLEQLVEARTAELNRRVTELTALNRLFQRYLSDRSETERRYATLAQDITRIAKELHGAVDSSVQEIDHLTKSA